MSDILLACAATACLTGVTFFLVGAYSVLRDFGALIDDGYRYRNLIAASPIVDSDAQTRPTEQGKARRARLTLISGGVA